MAQSEDRRVRTASIALECVLLLIAVAAASHNMRAACHVVTPSGSGAKTGADWNNAYAGLPETLVRGDAYYLADGNYASYVFTTADSGTTLISIKKAIAADHCTDTGWNLGTMGSAQAVFQGGHYGDAFTVRSDYLVLDGQVGAGEGVTAYGFKIDEVWGEGCGTGSPPPGFCRDLGIGDTGAVTDITIQYLEIAGACSNINLATNPQACDTLNDSTEEEAIFIDGPSSNLNFDHLYVHHIAGGPFVIGAANTVTIKNSFIGPNNATPTQHDNCIGTNGSTNNVTIAYNSLHDCEGTSMVVSLNSGTPYTNDSWAIYANWVWYTANNGNNRRGVGNGFFGCINGNECTNVRIYNNTLANMTGPITKPRDGNPTQVSGNIGINYLNGATGSATVENNLWYNNAMHINFAPAGTWTEDYNTSLNPRGASSLAGAHDTTVTSGASDPFQSGAGGDYHLTNESATGLAGGLTLPSPYNTDPDGVARGVDGTWERGAYEFGSGTAERPNPPVVHLVSVK